MDFHTYTTIIYIIKRPLNAQRSLSITKYIYIYCVSINRPGDLDL